MTTAQGNVHLESHRRGRRRKFGYYHDNHWSNMWSHNAGYGLEDELCDRIERLPSPERIDVIFGVLDVPVLRELSKEVVNDSIEHVKGRTTRLEYVRRIDDWIVTAEEMVEHRVQVRSLDVSTRLKEFKELEEGWLDGSGSSFDDQELDWLSATFGSYYPDDAQLPHTYPTEDGNVRMEWAAENNVMILEIDLNSHKGEWLWFDRESERDFELTLDMDSNDAWVWLASEINSKRSTGE